MQRDDPVEILQLPVPITPHLNEIDSALHELGMLATCTNARRQFLEERQLGLVQPPTPRLVDVLRMNTRYVSNVSIGFRLRAAAPHNRFKPYNSHREVRNRTRSESEQIKPVTAAEAVPVFVAPPVPRVWFDGVAMKRTRSLEDVAVACPLDAPLTPELEISNYIEKLKVDG